MVEAKEVSIQKYSYIWSISKRMAEDVGINLWVLLQDELEMKMARDGYTPHGWGVWQALTESPFFPKTMPDDWFMLRAYWRCHEAQFVVLGDSGPFLTTFPDRDFVLELLDKGLVEVDLGSSVRGKYIAIYAVAAVPGTSWQRSSASSADERLTAP